MTLLYIPADEATPTYLITAEPVMQLRKYVYYEDGAAEKEFFLYSTGDGTADNVRASELIEAWGERDTEVFLGDMVLRCDDDMAAELLKADRHDQAAAGQARPQRQNCQRGPSEQS